MIYNYWHLHTSQKIKHITKFCEKGFYNENYCRAESKILHSKIVRVKTVKVIMKYGRKGLAVNLQDDWNVRIICNKAMPTLEDPKNSIGEALENPIGCGGINELVRGKKKVCIVICDITRPVPNGLILPVLVNKLLTNGVDKKDICILVATGLHRPNEGDELREVVGSDWVLKNITTRNHFARDDADHMHLGITSMGTKVRLDRRLVEADLRILVGLVEPHFMAGYSGGRKLITPGVAHEETITYLHNARFMGDAKACNCNLTGNPLHEQQLEIVEMLGGALSVNVVIDEYRRLSFVNFGEVVQSHLQAVKFLRPYAEVPVPRKFKTVLTSAAGYPLDKTYYQTVKGMVAAKDILAPGGDLFIVSKISEGIGSPEYIEAQKLLVNLGVDGFWRSIEHKPHAEIDAWQTQKQLEAMRIGKVHLYSEGLSKEDSAFTGVNLVEDLEMALVKSAYNHKQVAVIPQGPYVLPFVKQPNQRSH